MFANVLAGALLMAGAAQAQVTATGTMGPTNPPQATAPTAVNQTSMSRLISLNSINDFCLFGPPEPNSVIGETEAEEVAWCVQPRNDARVIPDGTFTSAHFVKTPLYWQIQGWGDFTKINIQSGDEGGELDPHGATGLGNPVGGNVTTNATGSDVHYEEWMNYMAYNQFCLRICIAENSTYSAALMCQHTLDEMGCEWVMPGDYTDNSFTTCDADAAYPPGVYPEGNGETSTFAQRYTGTYTSGTVTQLWTVGQTVTPQSAYSVPASSNCVTYSTIGNGIASLANGAVASGDGVVSGSMPMSASSAMMTASSSSASGKSGSSSKAASGSSASGSAAAASASAAKSSGAAFAQYDRSNYGPIFGGLVSVVAVLAGAGSLFL